MPLSEREQKILEEIEQGLYEQDPRLVKKVGRLTQSASRRGVLAIVGFLVGLVVTIGTFAFSQWIALAGFVLMVLSASAIVQIRRHSTAASKNGWIGRILGGNPPKQ